MSLAGDIEELERRPAHLTQSAEESSLDAWLEKYPAYHAANRSISYYNKGDLLGVLLDLELREASHGAASLRDVFQWMNQNYARPGLFFPDSEGVRRASEAVGHTDLGRFFRNYVAGTAEIPWDDFFRTVGLHLVRHTTQRTGFGICGDQKPRPAARGERGGFRERGRARGAGRRRLDPRNQWPGSHLGLSSATGCAGGGRNASPAGAQPAGANAKWLGRWEAARKSSLS